MKYKDSIRNNGFTGLRLASATCFLLTTSLFLGSYLFLGSFMGVKQEILTKPQGPYSLLEDYLGNYTSGISSIINKQRSLSNMYTKVVWMLFDDWPDYALIPAPQDSGKAYLNNFEFCNRMGREKPLQTFQGTFGAESPTMTIPRVEAFLTGSHPPILKMAKSFALTAVNIHYIYIYMERI